MKKKTQLVIARATRSHNPIVSHDFAATISSTVDLLRDEAFYQATSLLDTSLSLPEPLSLGGQTPQSPLDCESHPAPLRVAQS